MLDTYITDTRDLIRDVNGQFFSNQQIINYINRARVQIAKLTGCIQILAAGGSPFGSDATVGTAVVGGAILGAMGNPQSPVTFMTIAGQEKYPYGYANPLVQAQNAGVKGIVDVIQVAVSWGSLRPALSWMPWPELQAYARAWNVNVTTYPSIFSTLQDGENGSIFLYPIPSQALEMEWLTTCLPIPLVNDTTPEAIPSTFQDAVKYWAAKLAFESSQRFGMADLMSGEFKDHLILDAAAADRGKVPSWYDEGP